MWLSIAITCLAVFVFFYDLYRIYKEFQVRSESVSFMFAPLFLLSSYGITEQGDETNYLAVLSLAMLITMGHILIVTINWWYFVEKHQSKNRFRFFATLGSVNLLLLQIYGAYKSFFEQLVK